MITLQLTKDEATAICEGLLASLDFSFDNFMFSPDRANGANYNDGNFERDKELQAHAITVIKRLNNSLLSNNTKVQEVIK